MALRLRAPFPKDVRAGGNLAGGGEPRKKWEFVSQFIFFLEGRREGREGGPSSFSA